MSKQQLADQTAQKNGFDYAVYLGERDGSSVFMGERSVPADTGLPLVILIDDQNNVKSDFTLDYMDMVKE